MLELRFKHTLKIAEVAIKTFFQGIHLYKINTGKSKSVLPPCCQISTYNTESLALPCCQIFGDMEKNQQQSYLTNYDANPEI